MNDSQLLQEFVRTGSDQAFAGLVAQHADWVYSSALRRVRDKHLAEDVTQAVFLLLSQKAAKLGSRTSLGGWLYNVVRYTCAHVLRDQARRLKHERGLAAMFEESHEPERQETWRQVAPQLEEMVDGLGGSDREALLQRFYQQKSMAQVGDALGVSEDAAKKRVARAIDKLRRLLARRALLVPTGALGGMLLANTTHAAPANLVMACGKPIGLCAGPAVGISQGATKLMMGAKLKIVAMASGALPVATAAMVTVAVVASRPDPSSPTLPVDVAVAPRMPAIAPATPVVASQPSLLTAISRAQRTANRVTCASNLKRIGQAYLLYANSHGGKGPTDLGTLANDQQLPLGMFLCPNAGQPVVPSISRMSQQEIVTWVNTNTDYVYRGSTMTTQAMSPDYVLMYEKDSNENGDGMNRLFADGHVEFGPVAQLQRPVNPQ